NAHSAAPLGPGPVVVAHLLQPEKVLEHEPGVAGPLSDAAVRDDVVAVGDARPVTVDRVELGAGLEATVLGDRLAPRHALSGGDVAGAQAALLGVRRGGGPLAVVLLGGAHVDQRALTDE